MKIDRLFDILSNAREQFPSKTDALVCKIGGEWKTYSVNDYYETAQYLSYGLIEYGLKKGDRVATASNNRPEWNIVDMALLQAGLVQVPLYTTLGESDYEFILNHCEPELAIVSDECLFNRFNDLRDKISSLKDVFTFNEIPGAKNWQELLDLGKKNADKHKTKLEEIKQSILSEDMATIIYTSGTTGNPKGVMLSHKNIISNLNGITQIFNFGPEDRTLSFLPISHIFERTVNYYFQYIGVSIYYAESLGTISANLKEVQPDIFIAVPRVLEKIYDKIIGVGKDLKGIKKQLFFWAVNLGLRFEFDRKNGWFYQLKLAIASKLIFSKWRAAVGNKVRLAVTGSAAIQPRIIRVFNAAGIPLVEGYGMTETSPVIAANDLDHGKIMIGTVGPPLPGVEVKIANDGEILVKGDLVMLGYYKNPEQTAEVIDKEGWMHTGDVGEIIDNTYVKITDRKKEIFKLSSGKYIAPQAIENKFKESFFIEQLMVVGENEKFASALISPNFQFLHNWCSRHNVKFRDNEDLIANKQVIARYQREVNEMNKDLGQTEHIKRFRLVKEEWTPYTGELSPTLKLKRRFLYNKYDKLLSEIYSVQKENA
jgi:long-chain acyl-CoA synthetase